MSVVGAASDTDVGEGDALVWAMSSAADVCEGEAAAAADQWAGDEGAAPPTRTAVGGRGNHV